MQNKNHNLNHFKNKKIIITGHTGFKGAWLAFWLNLLGAEVYGISLKPTFRNLLFNILNLKKIIKKSFIMDIKKKNKIEKIFLTIKPDYIFHLAAQAIVKESYFSPLKTWETNLIGTVNVLEICKKLKKQCNIVMITSDKCYKNLEKVDGYLETDELGGSDPYSASKASAELAIHSYYESFFCKKEHQNIRLASVRAGNVIGGGDWSEGRIVPDCIKSWIKGKKVLIRSKNSVRPWQHVFDALHGYLLVAIKLKKKKKISGNSFNFGPDLNKKYTVKKLTQRLSKIWVKKNLLFKFTNHNAFKETKLLQLNTKKSKKLLNWKSKLTIQESVDITSNWYYANFILKKNMQEFSTNQIKEYMNVSKKN